MNEFHIDIETYDVAPTSAIHSIGAVCETHRFYVLINPIWYIGASEFTSDPATIVFHRNNGTHMPGFDGLTPWDALHKLNSWIDDTCRMLDIQSSELQFWAAGDLDHTVLHHHYSSSFGRGIKEPWAFYQWHDIRTIRRFVRDVMFEGKLDIHVSPDIPHHAMFDALAQQKTYDAILNVVQKDRASDG